MRYPRIMTEAATIELMRGGRSIARFGDGELRIAIGNGCTSQHGNKALAREFVHMLAHPGDCLIGIPNFGQSPRRESWRKYFEGSFARLYRAKEYASAFITRPDSAPWIDTPEYWESVRQLWRDRDIVLVIGDRKSITPDMMTGARSIREVWGPRQHAYSEIARIEEEIGKPSGSVILCLGATATALAFRLHRKGVHALDLGHMGMFMKHAGAYRFGPDDLASPAYREQLRELHSIRKWGKDGHSHAEEIRKYIGKLKAESVLDYGAGMRTLKPAISLYARVYEYDPGVPEIAALPKPVDLVVSTDVLEHIEPKRLKAVLQHQYRLARKGCYHVIATKPARAILPDGRNAHLIIQEPEWWIERLSETGWKIEKTERRKGLHVWARK